jgi:hypothetical protein
MAENRLVQGRDRDCKGAAWKGGKREGQELVGCVEWS